MDIGYLGENGEYSIKEEQQIMKKSMYYLLLNFVILGICSGAFAEDCNVTVKCVCESQKSLRVVPCPSEFSNTAIDCTKEGIPEGTCGVDCGQEVEALCEEIPIQCKSIERANCLVTLPIMVGTTPVSCQPGETLCTDTCVDTNTDESNCGQCGTVCALGDSCVSGACISPCQPGETVCSDTCVDTNTDESNCGQCGTVCALGDSCVSGACISPCQPGETVCSDTCVDTNTDESNCGQCGTVCALGDSCVSGACISP